MASNYTLDVQDTASVDSWKSEVQELNERTERTVKEAAQALEEFRTTAEGNIFEAVCDLSSQIVTGTTEVMKGMTELLNAVTKFVDLIKSKSAELVQGVANVASKLF